MLCVLCVCVCVCVCMLCCVCVCVCVCVCFCLSICLITRCAGWHVNLFSALYANTTEISFLPRACACALSGRATRGSRDMIARCVGFNKNNSKRGCKVGGYLVVISIHININIFHKCTKSDGMEV